ncbi:hypothetical protein HHL19_14875 [Streptomyces sp. R302]|uniref:hypothetical protein n=1 Tax=unclassified Streptomyces TaxID=2593676 RepID=UPI00145C850C|nr:MULTISPECIES: hypothetical protein [unclassified Streptomyces]NML51356.1 hypothetical protein [Streptomyces sp. R301]NML79934.1 hypothetical protein [Streptomyces sp. R302]
MTERAERDTLGAEALAALGERFGTAVALEAAEVPTLVWTDGPTVAEAEEAARAVAPEAAARAAFRRELSETSVALGALRLAVAPSTLHCGLPVPVSPSAVARLWRDTPLPAPATAREERLVHALLYEVHDDHRANAVTPQQICDGLMVRGVAALARRMGLEATDGDA